MIFLFDETNAAIEFQNARIDELQQKMIPVKDSISLVSLQKECAILFPQITQIGFSDMEYIVSEDSIITVPTFYIQKNGKKKIDYRKLKEWLQLRTDRDTIHFIY